MAASVYIDRIIRGEFRKKLSGGKIIFEIDYSLKNLLDAFSRNLCWFLGQSAYKLITIKEEEIKGPETKEDELEQLILHSNLLAGGVEPRLVEKVFTPEG